MFERYTEKARRVIFFARYEASYFGSAYIETEHLLLGLLREDKRLQHLLNLTITYESIRQKVENRSPKRPGVATSVDLPLSNECKGVLAYAAEEAEGLDNRHIGTEHLLLGLLREKECFAAALLMESGLELESTRAAIAAFGERLGSLRSDVKNRVSAMASRAVGKPTFRIHDRNWEVEYITTAVSRLRETAWYWEKKKWQPRDIVICRADGEVSFDLSLAQDAEQFQLVKNGWTHDLCAVCRWKLSESTTEDRGMGYTNGRDWICTECYDRFFSGPSPTGPAYADTT
jgi:hypothetical protein